MPTKPSSIEIADTIADLMNGIAGWLLIALGIAASVSGVGGAIQRVGTIKMLVPLVVLGFGLSFMLAGVFVNPRFRQRINRRRGLSRFGQVETVEDGTTSKTDDSNELCIRCDSSQDRMLVRRYRQEFVVAGIPVWTWSENHNVYCPSCAFDEFPSLTAANTNVDQPKAQAIAETE